MDKNILNELRMVWSSTSYRTQGLASFAEQKTVMEARRGLGSMSLIIIVILMIEAGLFIKFELDYMYLYTCAILMVLAVNIWIASRSIVEPQALYLLGVTLLIVSGTAFVLLAHYQQVFHPMLFASIALLFMVVPMMPWGLRESLTVTGLIYLMFTLSTLGARFNFDLQSLWTLQFIMLATGVISLSLVVRNVQIRKHDLETQHDLVVAHDHITSLSMRDPLTGAWNRRYFDETFEKDMNEYRNNQRQIYFMLADIDDFKIINDNCGHECGDMILRQIGQVFQELIANRGRMVRMGGDEFAMIFVDLEPTELTRNGIRKLREATADSIYSELVDINLSFGVACVPPHIEVSQRQLYKQADLALYQAKNQKKRDATSNNIVISRLCSAAEVEISTQRLWASPLTTGKSTG